HAARAPSRRVTEHLPLPGDRLPEEREQCSSALFRGLPPEAGFRLGNGLHAAALLVEQNLVRPAEQLLPAQPVIRDEEHILGLEGGTIRSNGRSRADQEANER